MKNLIFLLTKDCVSLEALPVYGNQYWETPNIDELAKEGTVFKRHYAVGASTAMSISGMLSGHYPYEFKSRKFYTAVQPSEFPSIFDYFQENGYETHLIWDQLWMTMAWPFTREFGDENKLILHNLDICQRTGSGKIDNKPIFRNDELLTHTLSIIENEINSIKQNKPLFIWMHLPHVLKGRRCYIDDMDAFDKVVGMVRKFAGDENVYLSTDHGHMNMHKGQVGYGFNVYEPVIHIPLITPKIDNSSIIDYLTSNLDIPELLIHNTMPKRDYVISETQYYWQPARVTAIVTEKYKYIYNKLTNTEELYDLEWDPEENYNIIVEGYFDTNRKKYLLYDEYYFYPEREKALKEIDKFRQIKDSFWTSPTPKEIKKLKNQLRYKHLRQIIKNMFGK